MKNQTRGIDYFNIVNNFLKTNNINIKKLVCVCIDGCLSMTGREKGFISLLKKNIQFNKYFVLFTKKLVKLDRNSRSPIPEIDLVMKNVIKIIN